MSHRQFQMEVLVDFTDDCVSAPCPISAAHIDAAMAAFKAQGIKRVTWADHDDFHGGILMPGTSPHSIYATAARASEEDDSLERPGISPYNYLNIARTYELLGNPLKVAAEAAHRHGLQIFAYYKPYEMGVSLLYPEGSPGARLYGRLAQVGGRLSWLNRFVNDHPHLRIARRADDLPAKPDNPKKRPVCGIKLFKKNDSPTRIRAKNLQLWVSDLNYRYTRLKVPFEYSDSIEPALRDVRDGKAVRDISDTGKLITRQGDPVRVLTLSGFQIEQPFIVVTTDFDDPHGDFENAATDMIVALDANGEEILGSVGTGASIHSMGTTNFREHGLDFDYGWGHEQNLLDSSQYVPAPGWPRVDGQSGCIGYARGRNAYLPGALCETEPEVQEYWLRWLNEVLDSGVDGIDIREENHSCSTDYNFDYGYNPAVIAACAGDLSPANIARVRGNAYTEFLRRVKGVCEARGKTVRINFQVDWYRHDPPLDRYAAYPANLDFQWRRWIEEGLCDEAMLRFFAIRAPMVFEDAVSRELIDRCTARGLPLFVNRYVGHNEHQSFMDSYRHVKDDPRYAGFIVYEGYNFVSFLPDGSCSLFGDEILEVLATARAEP